MSYQLAVKKSLKRKASSRAHGRTRAPVRWLAAAFAGSDLALDGAGVAAPSLTLPVPGDRRDRIFGGLLSLLLHLFMLAGLIVAALLAPQELVDRIIRVSIVQEERAAPLPGSNQEPAPAGAPQPGPKRVGGARPNAAALAAAQALTPAQAEALRQAALEAARRARERLSLEAEKPAVLPTQIERRKVEAASVAARAAASAAPVAKAVPIAELEAVRIDPAELAAAGLDLSGPRQIDTSSLGDLSAPEAFRVLASLGQSDYTGSVEAGRIEPGVRYDSPGGEAGGSGLDTGVRGAHAGEGGSGSGHFGAPGEGGSGAGGGGGSGGTGTARGVVRCLDSAIVQRYLAMVQERTSRRWSVPQGVAPDTQVVLRFDLDAAGMAANVEAHRVSDDTLGESAMRALLSAAPFPPMDDANRCLTDKRIILTFTVPRP